MAKVSKVAICISQVPAILSPTSEPIDIGQRLEYKRISFRNGEHHLILNDRSEVPAVFFDF